MAALRPLTHDESARLLGILHRGSATVVSWRRAQIVLLSAQAMDAQDVARVTFTSEERVRDVIAEFNRAGFDSLDPGYR
jgi:hypothetical protein